MTLKVRAFARKAIFDQRRRVRAAGWTESGGVLRKYPAMGVEIPTP